MPAIKINAIVVPCRACFAGPGTPCASLKNEFHATREADARLTGELMYDREARPSAVVRGK